MSPRAAPAAFFVGLFAASCAATARTPGEPARENPGELAPARPVAIAGEAAGETGSPVSLRVGTRRESAGALYLEMLRRVSAHDAAGAAALFDDTARDLDTGGAEARREQISALFEAYAIQDDVTTLTAALPGFRLTTYTPIEARQQINNPVINELRDGWVVQAPPSWGPANALQQHFPTRVVVRFGAGEPRIVGANHLARHR